MTTNAKNALIVDDNDIACEYVEAQLSDLGMTSTTCLSAKEAFEELDKQSFDLVILDLKLPKSSGFEIAERILSNTDRPVPVLIATSGFVDDLVEQQCKKAGFVSIIPKPSSREEITNIVLDALKTAA